MKVKNNYPLYIPTKSRFEYMMTSKALTKINIFHYIIVEQEQYDDYCKAIKESKLLCEALVLDNNYKKEYELCDNLGLTKSTGPGPARNFAWDDSIKKGFDCHWVMDDNIRYFCQLNNNIIKKVYDGLIFKYMEDFILKYSNVGMGGPNYEMFVPRKSKLPPFTKNTRIYSCNFIRNSIPFRWRGRYNEDTILSLDMLKAGWCTIQFNAFMQEKLPTQTLKGGNTKDFYHAEGTVRDGQRYADTGTLLKSKMLANVHPDVAKVVYRFKRIHHFVDYKPFKNLALIPEKINGK